MIEFTSHSFGTSSCESLTSLPSFLAQGKAEPKKAEEARLAFAALGEAWSPSWVVNNNL